MSVPYRKRLEKVHSTGFFVNDHSWQVPRFINIFCACTFWAVDLLLNYLPGKFGQNLSLHGDALFRDRNVIFFLKIGGLMICCTVIRLITGPINRIRAYVTSILVFKKSQTAMISNRTDLPWSPMPISLGTSHTSHSDKIYKICIMTIEAFVACKRMPPAVIPTLSLLAGDLRFFASSPALLLWYINLPLFTSTINIEYLAKNKTDLVWDLAYF